MQRIRRRGVLSALATGLCVLMLATSWSTSAQAQVAVTLSEIRIDQPGADNDEYVEFAGAPDTSLDGLTYLVIGDGTGGSGVVEAVIDLSGQVIPASGSFVAAEASFTLGTADLTTDLNHENDDNLTVFLVEGFTGAGGDDLDTNDDGTLDVTPWSAILDEVALVKSPNPPSGTERAYSSTTVGPDGSFVPGHAHRCADGWTVAAFDPADGDDTPGAENDCEPDGGGGGEIGACTDPATLISTIQGTASASPEVGNTHDVQGIVVGDFQAEDELEGFFLQEEGADSDGDPLTSEGIFVFDNGLGVDVNIGDVVRVRGEVAEYFDLTELTSISGVVICDTGASASPMPLSLPVGSPDDFEPAEGMLVTFDQTLYVTENYNTGRFGEVDLASDGRLFTPTHLAEPGAPALALEAENDRRRILLDDGSNEENPVPPPPYFGADGTIRAGDTTDVVTGVLSYGFSRYRIHPTEEVGFTRVNERPEDPEVSGTLHIASFNVLNYFTTIDEGDFICGPSGSLECRGADSAAEFELQRSKILDALAAIDADVVGLLEIENNDSAAVADLVAGLNDILGAGAYAYVDTGTIGTDAIEVAFIYKPGTVALVGDYAILDSSVDPEFLDDKNRPVLAQTFEELATGAH